MDSVPHCLFKQRVPLNAILIGLVANSGGGSVTGVFVADIRNPPCAPAEELEVSDWVVASRAGKVMFDATLVPPQPVIKMSKKMITQAKLLKR